MQYTGTGFFFVFSILDDFWNVVWQNLKKQAELCQEIPLKTGKAMG